MRELMTVALSLGLLAAARADDPAAKALPVIKEYKGRIANELAKSAPKERYVAGPKEWAKLWADWKLGKAPAVDWKKEIVLVGLSGGSGLSLTATLDDKGDLKTRTIATADLRPDTGYWFVVVPSKGVKTIGGKEPKFEKKDEEP